MAEELKSSEGVLVSLVGPEGFATPTEAEVLANWMIRRQPGPERRSDAEQAALIQQINEVLRAFREQIPEFSRVRARSDHGAGTLILRLTPQLFSEVAKAFDGGATSAMIETGNAPFDAMNRRFGLNQVKLAAYMNTVLCGFGNLTDVSRAQASYQGIDGVVYAEPNRRIGDGPNLRVAKSSSGVWHVAIRNAWGDCPSGCLYSELRYYSVDDGAVAEVDSRNMSWFPAFGKSARPPGRLSPPVIPRTPRDPK